MLNTTTYHLQFFTATIIGWKKLLQQEKYKIIITDALAFLAKENKVQIFAYVIIYKIFLFFCKLMVDNALYDLISKLFATNNTLFLFENKILYIKWSF